MVRAIDDLLAQNWGRSVALVTSAANITAILDHALGASCADLRITHTSISELTQTDGVWRIEYANRREHLPLPPLKPVEPTKPAPAASVELQEDLLPVIQVYNRVSKADVEQKIEDDRKRMRHLLDFAELPSGLRALDIGAGLGVLAMMLAEDGASGVIGIDISPACWSRRAAALEQPHARRGRVSFRLSTAQELPFNSETFDLVTCRLVLNHARAPERIVNEAVRVLKPGGFLLWPVLSVDNPVKARHPERHRGAAQSVACGCAQRAVRQTRDGRRPGDCG